MKPSLQLFLGLCILANTARAAEWPQWRGPAGQGHATAKNLPTEWSETKNVTWKTPLPGRGWSSPVIEGEHIWMTTAVEQAASEEEIKNRLKANTGGQPLTVLQEVRLHAVCVDRASGRILHNIEVLRQREPQWVHKLNSYASPSPVIEDGRLYCHFGAYGTACVETASGKVKWRNQELAVHHENGPGSTPVIWKDLLIFHMDGSDKQFVVALDKATGKVRWQTPRSGKLNENPQLKKSYGTPLVIENNGKPQLISPGADWVYAYDPATGRELWKLPYGELGFSISPRPVVGHGMIFMSTSFMRPQILAIRYEQTAQPHIAWSVKRGAPQMPSPILIGDELYFISDAGGLVTCLDAHTGKELWQERLGGNYSASPTFADGKLFFHSREGLTTVVQPDKTKLQVLSKNQLEGQHMATLSLAGSALFLRTDTALYRIEKK
ncbi:MAG: hypothetical protein EXS22_06105 [Pedosphaera sp.]|nr:hypothetical protein [Pedosphaera sp.]MSU43593.1 hypothetical protein [Pedosphaera sp.]